VRTLGSVEGQLRPTNPRFTATSKNGVLIVKLPRRPASKGTTIPVKAE
jgi:HSP20 family molecular chaperone IbpA